MNRQKSRSIVENVLSGTKAGFRSILNLVFNQNAERKKMDNQWSISKFSAILLAFIMGVAVFLGSPAVAADKKMVKDPSTGEMVSAPEYGGTFTWVSKEQPVGPDTVVQGIHAQFYVAGVLEKLALADWATPRDKFAFQFLLVPTNTRGALAESWSQSDPLTYIVKVRQGVHWHDKPPMNGRELTARDIEFNFHRLLGLGSGFTERSEHALAWPEFESVTATDKWTVVFKMKELNVGALHAILDGSPYFIYPPEVIMEHGDVTDWRNLVGTGPMMLTDWVDGSSVTWTKNSDYWGNDEKYPENRLPYLDRIRSLIMPEVATYMAAIRSAKVDFIGAIGLAMMTSPDQLESLQRTNPELVIQPFYGRSNLGIGLNVQLPHFSDIRVRIAMQKAINLDEINQAYWGGDADVTPQGQSNVSFTAIVTPFEEWPEELKESYTYDPEAAEALLDAAGYPRGADGIRFKTNMMHWDRYDLNYVELVASYWRKLGIEVEDIEIEQISSFMARRAEREFEMLSCERAMNWFPMVLVSAFTTGNRANRGNASDPHYDALYEAAKAATTVEEQNRLVGEMNQYEIEQKWCLWGPIAPGYIAIQPWVKGYNAELNLGANQYNTVFTRLWIDSDLKKEMGH